MWLLGALFFGFGATAGAVGNIDYIHTLAETLNDGYFLDPLSEPLTNVALAQFSDGPEVLECPSPNVITTRYKCSVNGEWVDCSRKHCCQDYTFIAGRCVLKDQDPCSMNLCEQQCTVLLQRVICTCFDGYRFSAANQRNGVKPFCVDVDECMVNNGDCEHECLNEMGTHRCSCKEGFVLEEDNRTCAEGNTVVEAAGAAVARNTTELPASRDRCFASCGSVSRLHDKLKLLSEKVSALSTAIRLASFASGPPGAAGPPGPPGHPGPRGFPGPEGSAGDNVDAADNSGGGGGGGGGGAPANSHNHDGRDYTYSILDAFVPLPGDETTHCRCKRGPQGPAGPPGVTGAQGLPGERGQRGSKGAQASFDLLLLVIADLRHDIQQIQTKVFSSNERPTKFDVHAALEQQRVKGKQKLRKQYEALVNASGGDGGGGATAVMEMNVAASEDGRDADTLQPLSKRQMVTPKVDNPSVATQSPAANAISGTPSVAATSFRPTAAPPLTSTSSGDPTDDYEEEDASSFSGEMTYEDYL